MNSTYENLKVNKIFIPQLTLHYSKLLSIPFVSNLLYYVQVFAISRNVVNHFYVSLKDNSSLHKCVIKLNNLHIDRLYFTDIQLHSFVKKIAANKKILDVSPSKFNLLNTQSGAYNAMWSLVFADLITPQTHRELKKILPSAFPVEHKIVVPYHEEDGVLCNFVLETVKALAKEGHNITLVSYKQKEWIISYLVKKIIYFTHHTNRTPSNVEIYQPLSLLPTHIKIPYKLKKIDDICTTLLLTLFIKLNRTTLLWSFDHLDLELVQAAKKYVKHCTVIYDCVDFYSSRDVTTDKITCEREKKHTLNVDAIFVNSQTLLKEKKFPANKTFLTFQGFDSTSFLSKNSLTKAQKNILKDIRKIVADSSKPIFGFVGNLDYRLDFSLLKNIVEQNQQAIFVFTESVITTPTEDHDKDVISLLQLLKSYKNVYFVPATTNRYFIKELLSLFDVGIIPYDIKIALVKNCFPMKFFEYLFCGLDILSTPITELSYYPQYVYLGLSQNQWNKYIKMYVKKKKMTFVLHQMKKLALQHSWKNKIIDILQKVALLKAF